MIKRALISVSDKTGAVDFAKKLSALGVEIISTGGTASALNESGIPTIEVQDLTGFPECLDGRVKTLHPKIHGGLLAIRANDSHMEQMNAYGVGMIDLVAVNLYPFKQTISNPDVSLSDAIEKIDIGGPAMLRSAAKNYQDVTVIVDPEDYGTIVETLEQGGQISAEQNFKLAVKAFEHTASYDALIAGYLGRAAHGCDYFPDKLTLTYEKKQVMRYGENPHQAAAFYSEPIPRAGTLATYTQLHGKELSYNNIGDLDGALSLLAEFGDPAFVAVKHANPCGVAVADNIYDAYVGAYESDTMSIYGGILAANRVIDARTAAEIRKIFIEIVAAPGYDEEAYKILAKKRDIRILVVDTEAVWAGQPPALRAAPFGTKEASPIVPKEAPFGTKGASPIVPKEADGGGLYFKKVNGGLLVQTNDNSIADMYNIKTVTEKAPTEKELADMWFAMAVVKHTKSNAIVLAKNMATIGVGPGQNSRIMAAKIAIELAGERAKSAVAASDAFFPLDDCVEAFAAAGVTAIIQPGGSKNDAASIEACNRYGIAMVFSNQRHFKH